MAQDSKIEKAKKVYKDVFRAVEKARKTNANFVKLVNKQLKIIEKIKQGHSGNSFEKDPKYMSAAQKLREIRDDQSTAYKDYEQKAKKLRDAFATLKSLDER